jgi:hypothetical protein
MNLLALLFVAVIVAILAFGGVALSANFDAFTNSSVR